jgi:hypothetical protein
MHLRRNIGLQVNVHLKYFFFYFRQYLKNNVSSKLCQYLLHSHALLGLVNALGFTQPLTEISTRNLPGVNV